MSYPYILHVELNVTTTNTRRYACLTNGLYCSHQHNENKMVIGIAVICFVAFLPDILDSEVEGRNIYIEVSLSVVEKFIRSHYR